MKTIKLKNMQSHRKTTLDLHPGVNVVSGPSDVGKSAVVRAIRAVAQNRPLGLDSFIRNHRGTMILSVDGVERVKSSSVNEYRLPDGTVFRAFKSGVPDEVTGSLQLGEVNIASQHSPHFLIDQSSGKVAKAMNEVADLEVIDRVLDTIRKDITQVDTQLKQKEELKEELANQVTEFDWVEGADLLLTEIETLMSSHLQIMQEFQQLYQKVVDFKDHFYIAMEYEEACSFGEKILDRIDSAMDIRNRAAQAREVVDLVRSTTAQLPPDPTKDILSFTALLEEEREISDRHSEILGILDIFDKSVQVLQTFEYDPEPFLSNLNKLEECGRSVRQLRAALEGVEESQSVFAGLEDEYSVVLDEFENFVREEKICPLCGQETRKH